MPARRAAGTSAVGVVADDQCVLGGPTPAASRMAWNMAGSGLPITSGCCPRGGLQRGATIAPAPGMRPPGVG